MTSTLPKAERVAIRRAIKRISIDLIRVFDAPVMRAARPENHRIPHVFGDRLDVAVEEQGGDTSADGGAGTGGGAGQGDGGGNRGGGERGGGGNGEA